MSISVAYNAGLLTAQNQIEALNQQAPGIALRYIANTVDFIREGRLQLAMTSAVGALSATLISVTNLFVSDDLRSANVVAEQQIAQ